MNRTEESCSRITYMTVCLDGAAGVLSWLYTTRPGLIDGDGVAETERPCGVLHMADRAHKLLQSE